MVKSWSIAVLLMLFSIFPIAKDAQAKILPQARGISQKSNFSTKGTGISVSPRLRGDRKALVVSFANLQNASAVSYALTYKTAIQEEGAIGALSLGSSTNTTELLFGTCSKNVCRYHTGIKNAKFEVSYTLKTGKKYLKRFKIKV